MPIVGISLNKIEGERKPSTGGEFKVENNISLVDLGEKEIVVGKFKQKGLRFDFKFTCHYQPSLGSLFFEGSVLFLEEKEKIEEIKKPWEKGKKLPPEIATQVINAALNKCNILSIKLSDELGLPVPLPLPKVKQAETKK